MTVHYRDWAESKTFCGLDVQTDTFWSVYPKQGAPHARVNCSSCILMYLHIRVTNPVLVRQQWLDTFYGDNKPELYGRRGDTPPDC